MSCLDERYPLSDEDVLRFSNKFKSERQQTPRILASTTRGSTPPPPVYSRESTPLPDSNDDFEFGIPDSMMTHSEIANRLLGPPTGLYQNVRLINVLTIFLDYSRAGMWIIHPVILPLYSRFKIFFRIGPHTSNNWTLPESVASIDHSQCERDHEHKACRIRAMQPDARDASSILFRDVPVYSISVQKAKKGSPALVIDAHHDLFGKVVDLQKFKDRTFTEANVIDETGNRLLIRTSCITLLEKIDSVDCL